MGDVVFLLQIDGFYPSLEKRRYEFWEIIRRSMYHTKTALLVMIGVLTTKLTAVRFGSSSRS